MYWLLPKTIKRNLFIVFATSLCRLNLFPNKHPICTKLLPILLIKWQLYTNTGHKFATPTTEHKYNWINWDMFTHKLTCDITYYQTHRPSNSYVRHTSLDTGVKRSPIFKYNYWVTWGAAKNMYSLFILADLATQMCGPRLYEWITIIIAVVNLLIIGFIFACRLSKSISETLTRIIRPKSDITLAHY